jgi:hypothetical protein
LPRTYLVFGDIEGKLDTLRVECTKCPRKGRYSVRKLIEKYGRKGNLMKWKGSAKRRLPKARCTQPARTMRSDLPRSAEGAMKNPDPFWAKRRLLHAVAPRYHSGHEVRRPSTGWETRTWPTMTSAGKT